MLILHMRPQRMVRNAFYIAGYLTLFLFFVLFSPSALAHPQHLTASGPTITKASLGFDGMYQDGNWVPVQVNLSNTGSDFTGKVAINIPSTSLAGPNSSTSTNSYQENIDLPPGAKKQITLSVPLNLSAQGANSEVAVNLLDASGHIVSHVALTPNTGSNLTLVGILSDTPNNFGQLNLALSNLLTTSGQTKSLTAATMPDQAALLKNFNVIVVDNFTTGSLSQEQLAALQNWVYQGGNLIVTGGPEWKRTLGALPARLLPVTINGTGNIPANKPLLPVNTLTSNNQPNNESMKAQVAISTGQAAPNTTTLLSSDHTPVIVQQVHGQGDVYYLAYDPTIEPLASWQNTHQLWADLLTRSIGDRILMNTANTGNIPISGSNNNMTYATLVSLLQSFFPNAYPSIWLILVLLLSYVIILGPLRLILIRAFKRRDWSWRIVLATIAIFTLLSYGLALQQKGSAIVNSSITLIQLNAPDKSGSSGHATTFLGVFVPSQGDFQVHMPGVSLVQPADQNGYVDPAYRGTTSNQQSIYTMGGDGTNVNLQGVDIWTTRTLIAQHDMHTSGGITSQLQLRQNILSGTVISTLPYTLTDAFVVMGNGYVSLGDIKPNSTTQVQLNLGNNASNAQNASNGTTIADQIASSRGMVTNPNGGYYSAYNTNNNQATDPPHRHALLLEALSGGFCDNTTCYHQAFPMAGNAGGVTSKQLINGTSSSDRDPLALAGATATIIGWPQDASSINGDITVNGQTPGGSQETMVQAPLDVRFIGTVQIPSGIINSQIVHIQQNAPGSIQEVSWGTYTMVSSNMTLEYTVPNISKLENSSLAFTSSLSPTRNTGQTVGATTNINHLQAYLYNWQTGNWDSVSFSEFTCTVKSAQSYIGTGGRILLHLSSRDTTAVFDKPTLTLQGTVAQ
ncbi:DUF7408 domain-containing protein [Dictyobacter aurantiacus]|uniref:DUF7408 domain-containing protein n=1 Tax=Dictyobacter aurantiacus TaxID=1936993 RepID=A0A401ZHD8_9CHLR|nr:hypothetical protein [Dictyobacter aurantiacus]GCE06256.1 hypothetical protein KDAU_35850 [Dictyobacter aurantiacus]